jgi:hypothetical protein
MGNGYVVPGLTWEHVTPESAGYSSARLEVLRAWLKTRPTTSMMAVYIRGRSSLNMAIRHWPRMLRQCARACSISSSLPS